MDKKRNRFYCNPFKKQGHWITKDLRNLTLWMTTLKYGIKDGMKICTSCCLEFCKQKHSSSSENGINMNYLEFNKNKKENPQPGCSKDDPEFMDMKSSYH
ncbi:hypothetical protein AVEN_57872-1 [Araneus ventricosus]|uniref:Uncharacterized protein n=1 Tax=Araneus ventricosus TaxID=182803 RepID=A0A4Y2KZD0_ARAVE|nr:hypothetical protein AVEN_57872-1 [Araneus ventricosus]